MATATRVRKAPDQTEAATSLVALGDRLLDLLRLRDPPQVEGMSALSIRLRGRFNAAIYRRDVEKILVALVGVARGETRQSTIPGLRDFRQVVLDLDARLDPIRGAPAQWRLELERRLDELEKERNCADLIAADDRNRPEVRDTFAQRRDQAERIAREIRVVSAEGFKPEYRALPHSIGAGVARALDPYDSNSLYRRFVVTHEALGRGVEEVRFRHGREAAAPLSRGAQGRNSSHAPTGAGETAIDDLTDRLKKLSKRVEKWATYFPWKSKRKYSEENGFHHSLFRQLPQLQELWDACMKSAKFGRRYTISMASDLSGQQDEQPPPENDE